MQKTNATWGIHIETYKGRLPLDIFEQFVPRGKEKLVNNQ